MQAGRWHVLTHMGVMRGISATSVAEHSVPVECGANLFVNQETLTFRIARYGVAQVNEQYPKWPTNPRLSTMSSGLGSFTKAEHAVCL